AVGFRSLSSNNTGGLNTAVGAGTLLSNTADENTATGTGALLSNVTGNHNTANGAFTLLSNTEGSSNVANGHSALFSNGTGNGNTAVGASALFANTEGRVNTATGIGALVSNTTGASNTATGASALGENTIGQNNTAIGSLAGLNQITGSGNVYIGAGIQGINGENNSCYISSIFGQTSVNGIPVLVNSSNKLGTTTSSKRFKREIQPMDRTSERLFLLKPVNFRYSKQIDPEGSLQFGLVAEEVEKVNPALVLRDASGQPYTVRYDAVNAMLLNEFLKEHKKIEEQARQIREQKAAINRLGRRVETALAQIEDYELKTRKVNEQSDLNQFATRRTRRGGPFLHFVSKD
ncbi:MAG TPA: tail fiber domain-containing protein, partial [Candidatus Udaeobacter sp.]